VTLHRLIELIPYAILAVDRLIATACALHAVVYKRDSRAAVSWVGVVWLVPILGWMLYVCFGINRIHRRAVSLRRRRKRIEVVSPTTICTEDELRTALGPEGQHLTSLARVGQSVTERPLLEGNSVLPLRNGEEAYPAMLEAIGSATKSVSLLAYIFEKDDVGDQFIEALGKAPRRR
jgi:cardiolipin synthase